MKSSGLRPLWPGYSWFFPLPILSSFTVFKPLLQLALQHFPSTHTGRAVFIMSLVLKKPLPSGHGWKSSSNHTHSKVLLTFLQQQPLSWNLHLPHGWLHLSSQEPFKFRQFPHCLISNCNSLLSFFLTTT